MIGVSYFFPSVTPSRILLFLADIADDADYYYAPHMNIIYEENKNHKKHHSWWLWPSAQRPVLMALCLRASSCTVQSPRRFCSKTQPSQWQKHRPSGWKPIFARQLTLDRRSTFFSRAQRNGVFPLTMSYVVKQCVVMSWLVRELAYRHKTMTAAEKLGELRHRKRGFQAFL